MICAGGRLHMILNATPVGWVPCRSVARLSVRPCEALTVYASLRIS
jgi:hypothetical protein